MTAAKVQALVGIVGFILVMSLLSTAFLKFFARGQTLISSLVGFTISAVLIAFYHYAKATMGLPPFIDGVAAIVMLILGGLLIAQRTRVYGANKAGGLGVGAKTILGLLVLIWIVVGLYVLITMIPR